jgi:hypothetical protein
MPNIIHEAWKSVTECQLLALAATDVKARQFFLNLANSWTRVARSYEELLNNDPYLNQFSQAHVLDSVDQETIGGRTRD